VECCWLGMFWAGDELRFQYPSPGSGVLLVGCVWGRRSATCPVPITTEWNVTGRVCPGQEMSCASSTHHQGVECYWLGMFWAGDELHVQYPSPRSVTGRVCPGQEMRYTSSTHHHGVECCWLGMFGAGDELHVQYPSPRSGVLLVGYVLGRR